MSVTVPYDFSPSLANPFQFQPTLDNGIVYSCFVTWNIYGQRWYLSIYTLTGQLVLSRAMVGSPIGYDISLTTGYFTTSIVYRIDNQQIEVITP